MNDPKIRVLDASNVAEIREWMDDEWAATGDLVVAGHIDKLESLASEVVRTKADVVLLSQRWGPGKVAGALPRLRKARPEARVVYLAANGEELDALRHVAAGQGYISEEFAVVTAEADDADARILAAVRAAKPAAVTAEELTSKPAGKAASGRPRASTPAAGGAEIPRRFGGAGRAVKYVAVGLLAVIIVGAGGWYMLYHPHAGTGASAASVVKSVAKRQVTQGQSEPLSAMAVELAAHQPPAKIDGSWRNPLGPRATAVMFLAKLWGNDGVEASNLQMYPPTLNGAPDPNRDVGYLNFPLKNSPFYNKAAPPAGKLTGGTVTGTTVGNLAIVDVDVKGVVASGSLTAPFSGTFDITLERGGHGWRVTIDNYVKAATSTGAQLPAAGIGCGA